MITELDNAFGDGATDRLVEYLAFEDWTVSLSVQIATPVRIGLRAEWHDGDTLAAHLAMSPAITAGAFFLNYVEVEEAYRGRGFVEAIGARLSDAIGLFRAPGAAFTIVTNPIVDTLLPRMGVDQNPTGLYTVAADDEKIAEYAAWKRGEIEEPGWHSTLVAGKGA